MRVVRTRRGYAVERKGNGWAMFGALLLAIPWGLFVLMALFAPSPSRVTAAVILTVPVVLLAMVGSRKRWPILGVADARQVPGGVMLRVIDSKQKSHELLVDQVTAQALAVGLTLPAA